MQRETDAGKETLFPDASPPVAPVNGHAMDTPPVDQMAVANRVAEILAEHRKTQDGKDKEEEENRFKWIPENGEIVVKSQPATAVYVNCWGQVVIRQEADSGETDDDPFIRIEQRNLPDLIARLQTYLPQPASKSRG